MNKIIEIKKKYEDLRDVHQWIEKGKPIHKIRQTPRKEGWYCTYKAKTWGRHLSIHASKNTPPCFTNAGIRKKWHELGAENSFLGFPITDEIALGNGNGKIETAYNNFQGGSIAYSFLTNTFTVSREHIIADPSFVLFSTHEVLSNNLLWEDRFEGEGKPNQDNWVYDIGGHGWGNNEEQYYTDREENSFVSDGTLKIKAIKEDYKGKPFTSARLLSKQPFLYGKFRIKAKCPQGLGPWAAIWMLPGDFSGKGWPDVGEIDIMEHVGFWSDKVLGTVHTKKFNHMIGTQKGNVFDCDSLSTEFHEFGLDWAPNELKWLVDGEIYYTLTRNDLKKDWPFNKPFKLLLNLAIGGNLGGMKGVQEDIWPQVFEVEYITVSPSLTQPCVNKIENYASIIQPRFFVE